MTDCKTGLVFHFELCFQCIVKKENFCEDHFCDQACSGILCYNALSVSVPQSPQKLHLENECDEYYCRLENDYKLKMIAIFIELYRL